MRLNARIAAIERRVKPAQLGWRTFTQTDDNRDQFYDDTYVGGVDYRRGIVPTDRTGQRRYTRTEIEALEGAGWGVTMIEAIENWREHYGVMAVIRPGMIDYL